MTATLHIFILICSITGYYLLQYEWVEYDDRFDCVVGISVDGNPVSTGVWIQYMQQAMFPVAKSNQSYTIFFGIVLTSRNPLKEFIRKVKDIDRVGIHTINGRYNETKKYAVHCIEYITGKKYEDLARHGLDGKHSSTHDLVTIYVTMTRTPHMMIQNRTPQRYPFVSFVANRNTVISKSSYWSFAGFGYIDKEHVRENNQLELESYSEPVLVDCDEWIPRQWGRFICLSNVDNIGGVPSGSPLLHKNRVFGIGSFSVTKGNEAILVFTDVRPYLTNNDTFGFCYFHNGSEVKKYVTGIGLIRENYDYKRPRRVVYVGHLFEMEDQNSSSRK